MLLVEQVIGSYAVKYTNLIPLINKEYAGCDSDKLNIFIDLAGIMRNLIVTELSNANPYLIVSKIINLCAHYRNFFREYYKTSTQIFLILSMIDNKSINKLYVPSYERRIYSPPSSNNDKISKAISVLNVLVPYIDDFYMCESNYEFGVHVYDIIGHQMLNGEIIPGMIISKDPYNYQLVSPDTPLMTMLRPKKNRGEDESFMVTNNSAIKEFCIANRSKCEIEDIDSSYLPLIAALTRMPERNIESLYKIPTVLKALSTAIDKGYILSQSGVDVEYVCDALIKNKLLKINDAFLVSSRFKAIDINTQYSIFSVNALPTLKYNGMVNLYDTEAVKEINYTYFKDHPLDLNIL